MQKFYLKPGEIYLTKEPTLITTILGSCLCITMLHRQSGSGAICHAVMPCINDTRKKTIDKREPFQYVDSSIEWMIKQYEKNRIRYYDIEVKMFGGSEMFSSNKKNAWNHAVGKKNIETAIDVLKSLNLRLKSWNVGGDKGRKIIFNTLTGEVLVKYVNKVNVQVLPTSPRVKQ